MGSTIYCDSLQSSSTNFREKWDKRETAPLVMGYFVGASIVAIINYYNLLCSFRSILLGPFDVEVIYFTVKCKLKSVRVVKSRSNRW